MLCPDTILEILQYSNLLDISNTLFVSKQFNEQSREIIKSQEIDVTKIKKIDQHNLLAVAEYDHTFAPISNVIFGESFKMITLEDNAKIYVSSFMGFTSFFRKVNHEYEPYESLIVGTIISCLGEIPSNLTIKKVKKTNECTIYRTTNLHEYIVIHNVANIISNVVVVDYASRIVYVNGSHKQIMSVTDVL